MLNISKGIVLRPQKVVVYGPEGIGKSTFASHFPDPLFLDIEDSTSQLDVKRIPDINSWAMLMGIIEEVTKENHARHLLLTRWIGRKSSASNTSAPKQRKAPSRTLPTGAAIQSSWKPLPASWKP